MNRSSTFLLATLTALALAACGPKRNDTNPAGGTGSETGASGATGSAYDTTSAMTHDTGHATTDTTAR